MSELTSTVSLSTARKVKKCDFSTLIGTFHITMQPLSFLPSERTKDSVSQKRCQLQFDNCIIHLENKNCHAFLKVFTVCGCVCTRTYLGGGGGGGGGGGSVFVLVLVCFSAQR